MMVVGALVKDRKLEKLEDYLSKWDKQPGKLGRLF